MLFTSLDFFVFLAAALALSGILPPRWRWPGLLAASAVFYGYAHPSNLLYLAGVTVVVLACERALRAAERPFARRTALAAGLTAVLGSLAFLKFGGLVMERVANPAGYSFYAFCAASLLVDAYRRQLPRAPAGHLALYLAWFPKILAGPIERATAFLPRLAAPRADPASVVLGLQLAAWGLFKKVVIADNLAPLVDKAFGIVAYASPVDLLLSVYFFAFQIYCDFSGYTDIAIGVSLLFGLPLMENFRRPYLARSTAEFWGERWHISLGRWFRDYLYIPLGGSRAGAVRTYLNLMIVFLASGLWHAGLGYGAVGWTFLAWGALNGLYQWGGLATRPLWRRLGEKLPRARASVALAVLRTILTFHLIAIAWIFFRARSMHDAWVVLRRLAEKAADLPAMLAKYPYTADHYAAFGLIAFLVAVEIVDERRSIFDRLKAAPVALRWAAGYAVIFALLLFGRWQAREFIYMQF
ncbi:MAG TPA: MBOAT family O-acyltransferase [Usitatibacter sp.]|nr:MBOAT family O-acyltransferase [Usitatibacter sp.]